MRNLFLRHFKNILILVVGSTAFASLSAYGEAVKSASVAAIRTNPSLSSLSNKQLSQLTSKQLDKLVADTPLDEESTSLKSRASVAEAVTANVEPSPPAPCQTMYFGTNGVRCYIYGDAAPTALQGTDASTIAALNQWCPEIPVGELLKGVTPAPGSLACYQLVVNASTAINFQASLPSGIVGTAEIFHVGLNGIGFLMARSNSPAAPLSASATTQYLRLALIIRTSTGNGGKVFGYGVNLPSTPSLTPNTPLSNAHVIDMNEEVNEVLTNNTDSAYYFYPLRPGQTKALVSVTFNSLTQQAAYVAAKKTGPNTYTTGTEIIIPATSSGTQLQTTSPYPVNVAGTTTPAGVIIRVTGTSSSAPANQPYTLRAGAQVVNISSMDITNTESITRWFPVSGYLQAANYITTYLGAIDDQGVWVKNQPVQLTVQRFNSDVNSKQILNIKTNIWGRIADNANIPQVGGVTRTVNFAAACTGTLLSSNNYGPPGNPTDHWKGKAQMGTVSALLSGATTPSPKYSTFAIQFTRICSETYLGYY